MATNKTLATIRDYDPQDITTTGYRWQLYADGRVAATMRNRWQGGRDGRRYVLRDAVDVSRLGTGDDGPRAALATLAARVDPEEDGWPVTDPGWIVR
jgi:hypothetical protein